MDRSLMKFREKSKIFIFVYLLTIALFRTLFEVLFSSSAEIFPFLLNIQFLTCTILFLFILLVIRLLVPELGWDEAEHGLVRVFWILVFSQPITRAYDNFITSSLVPFVENELGVIVLTALIAVYFFKKRISHIRSSQGVMARVSSFSILLVSLMAMAVAVFNQDLLLSSLSSIGPSRSSPSFLALWILLLIFEALFFFSITSFLYDREAFFSLAESIKPFRSLHFSGLTLIGLMVAYSLSGVVALFDLLVLIPIICMVLTWQFSTMINDLYDVEADEIVHPDRPLVKGKINPRTFRDVGMVCASLSLLLSTLFSVELFLANFLFVSAGVVYSIPPIRLKNRLFGHICVGYASMTAFLFGVYGTFSLKETHLFLTTVPGRVSFFPDIFSFSLLILVVFSLSPLINAVDDYEGDKEAGVKNLYTVLGFEKGKKVVAVLIILLFLTPLLIFRATTDLLLIVPASLISSFIFYRYENYKFVLGLYFLILLYILVRFMRFY
ncbi:MAG: UbiA family prenyltransferase [Candidatus Aenigmatarchaeota archaeon]